MIEIEYLRAKLVRVLVEYFGDDDRRIEHALMVLYHAQRIAEEAAECDMAVLIASALLHDVGIKVSELKHGWNNGKTQELYGPAAAEDLLELVGFPVEVREKVKNIIGNHHSPSRFDYPELAVLKEADLIVNRIELNRV